MGIVEKRIVTTARAATVFGLYRDVPNWSRWDPDTRASSLDPGLVIGARGRLTPTRGRTIPLMVSAVAPDRSFTVTSRTLLFRLDFDHELEPVDGGTGITHRVTIGGLLGPLLDRILAPRIEQGLPLTLERLKARAEAAESVDSVGVSTMVGPRSNPPVPLAGDSKDDPSNPPNRCPPPPFGGSR